MQQKKAVSNQSKKFIDNKICQEQQNLTKINHISKYSRKKSPSLQKKSLLKKFLWSLKNTKLKIVVIKFKKIDLKKIQSAFKQWNSMT